MPKREEHTGVIVDNDDPEKRGRVSVECPTIVAGDTLEWAEPEFAFVDSSKQAGSFFVPNIGSQVTVTIEAEDDSEVMGLDARWRCTIYPIDSIPEVFRENYPKRHGWVTAEGHILYFDDTEDQQTYYYKHPTGTEIIVDNDGSIQLKPASGQSVNIGSDSLEPLVLGDQLSSLLSSMKTTFDSHIHTAPAGGGPTTGPEFPALTPTSFPTVDSSILSTNHKVE